MFMKWLCIKITMCFSLCHIRRAVQLQTSGLNSVGSNLFHHHRNNILAPPALRQLSSIRKVRIAQGSKEEMWIHLSPSVKRLCWEGIVLKGPTSHPCILLNSHLPSDIQSCIPKLNLIITPLLSSPCLCHTRMGSEARWLFENVSAGFAAVPKFVLKPEKERTHLHVCCGQEQQWEVQGEHLFLLTNPVSSLLGTEPDPPELWRWRAPLAWIFRSTIYKVN